MSFLNTVYVDVLITVNIIIDYFMLLGTKRILHIRGKPVRLILGAVFGGFVSLVALLPALPAIVNLPIDLLSAAIIVLISFGRASPMVYFKRVGLYFTVSFCFCGIIMFVCSVFRPTGADVLNDVIYFNISPILLIILTLISYYFFKLIRRLTFDEAAKRTCSVELRAGDRFFTFCAAIDTGCTVREPFSGDLVIIADEKLLNGYVPPESNFRIIPFESLGGNGILKGFKPDLLKIDGVKADSEVYVGYGKNILKGETNALVPYEIISVQTKKSRSEAKL